MRFTTKIMVALVVVPACALSNREKHKGNTTIKTQICTAMHSQGASGITLRVV